MSIYGLFNGVDYRQLLDHFDPVVKSKNMVDNFVNLIAQVKTSRPIFMSLRYPRGREKSFPRYHHRSNGSVSLLEGQINPRAGVILANKIHRPGFSLLLRVS